MSRKKHSPEFKAKVALEAIKGEKTIVEICHQYGVHASVIHSWKSAVQSNLPLIFQHKSSKSKGAQNTTELHAKIGELVVERDFLKKDWNFNSRFAYEDARRRFPVES